MSKDLERYDSEWAQYRELVLAELRRQNEEIKSNQRQIRDLGREAGKQETKIELNNAKITFLVLFASTIVSFTVSAVKELLIK